jgi:hypothetical protein
MNFSPGNKVHFSDIKKGDLVSVKRVGIIPAPESFKNSLLAFILEGPHGNAGTFTFESKKGPGVILYDGMDTSCNIYYKAIVENRICKVYLRHIDLKSIQKK